MIDQLSLDKALLDHAMWKMRLSTVINLGTLRLSVEEIRRDDCCDFGRWLYDPALSDEDKRDPHYQKLKALHAEFHHLAARVAELALSGKPDEARQDLSKGGEYFAASFRLQSAIKAWKASLDK